MNKTVKQILILICFIVVLTLPFFVFAEEASQALTNLEIVGAVEGPYDISEKSIGPVVAQIARAFLGLLGIIFLVLMVLAGYNWMMAQGNEEKVTKAKDTIRMAIIGLIIVVGAYAITYFVFSNLPGGGGSSGINLRQSDNGE